MSDEIIRLFLEGEPPNNDEKRRWIKKVWFGEVAFHNRRFQPEVKALCQGDDARGSAATFCPIRKLWGTGSFDQVPKLLATTHWVPIDFDVALCQRAAAVAQRTLDDKERQARQAEARKEAAEQERKRKADSDAVAKAELRMRAERGWVAFGEAHYAQAAEWGMTPDMLRKTEQMGFLGFSAPNWQRVFQWFHIRTKCHGLTPTQVIETDFAPEYQKICAAEAAAARQAGAATLAKWPKRERLDDVDPEAVVARMRREEQARQRRKREEAERYRTDPHRLALEAIVAKSDAMPPVRSCVLRPCPTCSEVVDEQFLDCRCTSSGAVQWTRCDACMLLVHPKLNPCRHVFE